MAIAIVIGAFRLGVVNPIAAALYTRYETLEGELLRGRTSALAVSPTGFWLRQADRGGNSVIHALRVASREMELHDVIVFELRARRGIRRPLRRAHRRALGSPRERGRILSDAWISQPERPARACRQRAGRSPT